MLKTALLATVLSTVMGQTPEVTSEYEPFTEYGELTVGTWEGEFESLIALPGIVEEGDLIRFRTVTRWILDQKATESDTEILIKGNVVGSIKGLAYWDRSTKEVVGTSCGTFGGYTRSVFRKEGDSWIEVRTGVGVDGQKLALTAVAAYSEDGKSAKATFPGSISPSGEISPPLTIVLKRVDGIGPTQQDYIDFVTPYFPGKWDREVIDAKGNVLVKGTTTIVMAPGNACGISHDVAEDGTPMSTGIHGYSSKTGRWEVVEHFVDGAIATLDVNFDKETLKGGIKDGFTYSYQLTRTSADGETSQSSWTAHVIDHDTLEMRFVKGDNAEGVKVIRYERRK